MKITIVTGTRPNFVKIAPITQATDAIKVQGKRISYRLVYTGIENDTSLDASLFADLHIKAPDAYPGMNGNNPAELTVGIMVAFEHELTKNPTHVVLVVDDLTAIMSCAAVAKKQDIKTAHLVAGTRSFDMPMSKEVNRMITDGLSDYLFIVGTMVSRNLNQTGTENEIVCYVGNTLIDTIQYNRDCLIKSIRLSILGLKEHEYTPLTLNRHVLLNNKENLRRSIETLLEKANSVSTVAPLHTYARNAIRTLDIIAPNLHIMSAQSYLPFRYLMNQAKIIITDSGDVAKRVTFLGTPCITLNTYAEHPETWHTGTNELVGEDPAILTASTDKLMNGEWKQGTLPECWDGRTIE